MLPKCKWKVQKGEINVVKGLGVSFVIFQFAWTAVPEVGPREIRGYSSWTTATVVITALLFFFFFSLHFSVLESAEVREQGMYLAAVLIISLLLHVELYFSGNTWRKHLKSCPWSRELDHTTVLLWNFFFFFCGRSFKVRENAMSRQQACHLGCLLLLFEHKAYLASTDGCSRCWDCRLPASRHCSLKASVSNKYRLKPEESRIVFITAL